MSRATALLSLCCWLTVAANSPSQQNPSPATPINQAFSAIEPRVVPQFAHGQAVMAVQWIEGGRVLVSLDRDGSLVFWDVATRHVIDHAKVPAFDRGYMLEDFRHGADGRSLELVYYPVKIEGDEASTPACPKASPAGGDWCTYRVDLATREVRPDPTIAVPSTVPVSDGASKRIFPRSPDGKLRPAPNIRDGELNEIPEEEEHFRFNDTDCVSSVRCRSGVTLLPVNGGRPIKLVGSPLSFFSDADISPDGRKLVRVESLGNQTRTRIEAMDLTSGTPLAGQIKGNPYQRVNWLGEDRFVLFSDGYGESDNGAVSSFPPAMIVDPECAKAGHCPGVASYGNMVALGDAGSFLGTRSLEGCFEGMFTATSYCPADKDPNAEENSEKWITYLPAADRLALHVAGKPGWRTFDQPVWKDQLITAIRLSPDHSMIAVATRQFDASKKPIVHQILRVWLVPMQAATPGTPRQIATIDETNTEAKTFVPREFTDADDIDRLEFTPDGKHLVFSQFPDTAEMIGDLYVFDVADSSLHKFPGARGSAMPIGNDRIVDLGTKTSDGMVLRSLATGAPIAVAARQNYAMRAGSIARSNLFWTTGDDGTIAFRDAGDGSLQLTLYVFPGNRFFAVTPGGRYDTNLGPDAALIRWLVPDAPLQSLSAQTFMRDFYEPGLYGKLLDCREARTCAEVFKPLPAIASLNRVLPQVRIADVKPGKDASEAVVTVDVDQGVDPHAANGKTRSGIFEPRLFRNGRMVAISPDHVDATGGAASKRFVYTVALPTAAGSEKQVFSAYAFNEDRIKSETATRSYTRPAVAPHRPQAYVVTIGIDDYDTPRFRLNYSVADARLLTERLATIPGYDVHRLTLVGEQAPDGRRSRVDQATIGQVLSLLAGSDDREATLAALHANGVDASMLQRTTPDDLVIVSFSGHGWADPKGNFYLIPTNGRWPDGSSTPDLSTLFATADLTRYFQPMRAAEIALIIDACHSAASVADGRFKPGPMGDAGLGQLAYDKGIRILAATQADDVAMEDSRLKQGLLTYALAAEGLSATGGMADLNHDGRIQLSEWLAYAVQRMPALAADTRVGQIAQAGQGAARAIVFHDLPRSAAKRRVQQPALFDFNDSPSPVVLRQLTPPAATRK
jgi:dipeptidyl aminopeptidase/acylaminoacyl peptidase